MRNLFVARHGNYNDSDGLLTDWGRRQYFELGAKLKPVAIGSIYIMSSPAPRAYQSAEILAQKLRADKLEKENLLFPGEAGFDISSADSVVKLTKLVKERGAKTDNLVLVTHAEVCMDLSNYYAQTELGYLKTVGPFPYGSAVRLDCVNKNAEFL